MTIPRLVLTVTLAFALLAARFGAAAPHGAKVYRIGVPGTFPSPTWEALLQALRDLGWAAGKNIITERQDPQGRQPR